MYLNKWLVVLGGMFLSFFGTFSVLTIYSLINVDIVNYEIEGNLSLYEWLSLITQFSLFLGAIWTLRGTLFSIKNQKNQWLNDAFIKYEAEVLLEFRNKFPEASNAIRFFKQAAFQPKKYGFNLTEDKKPRLKRSEFVKNYNVLCHFNNLYNTNEHIFRKHGLDHEMSAVILIFKTLRNFPARDLEYNQVEKREGYEEYHIENWGDIRHGFIHFAVFEFDKVDHENMLDFLNNIKDEDFDRLYSEQCTREGSLQWKLDELTMYVEDKNESLARRSQYFSPLLEER
ncbi:hypothetical protein [Marinomonas colpomeniae]|uniref:Phage abortive infection protein n=1 Tax=Marinomonas colpomeniae TaxID=2774408 RepID=A0ABR8NU86_9GAMM|nr:hypothetical protein [Marinomonas colpomeniae]MBD5769613.1 hypothetical protein [Marinomonas colpomeniae]